MTADISELRGEPFESAWAETENPTTDIVEAVAAATEVGVHELPPIQEFVDGDALNALLTTSSTCVRTMFTYGGATVRAGSDGRIEVWTE